MIGIAGNIGSGKTTSAKIFENFGAHYISADELGWKVLSAISNRLKNRFGEAVVNGDTIDKKRLRNLVFSNRRNLEFLNRLSHPSLVKKLLARIKKIKSGVVVIDAALLFDWPLIHKQIDCSILVSARDNLKAQRALAKGISKNSFQQIIKLQEKETEMANRATFILKNNGTLAALKKKCRKIYKEIIRDY